MQLTVKGHQIDVGESLRSHVADQLSAVCGKYFQNPLDGTVIFAHDAYRFKAEILVRVGKGIEIQTSAEATEIYPAFDAALEKVARRLQKYKSRLRDHHQREASHAEVANQYVLNAPEHVVAKEDEAAEPAVVAEMQTSIGVMTVAEAVMHMDLAELPAFMFRNSAHNGLNMVYRRPDGNIGWVDPRGNQQQAA
jgi:ribosomal subunit interface protein